MSITKNPIDIISRVFCLKKFSCFGNTQAKVRLTVLFCTATRLRILACVNNVPLFLNAMQRLSTVWPAKTIVWIALFSPEQAWHLSRSTFGGSVVTILQSQRKSNYSYAYAICCAKRKQCFCGISIQTTGSAGQFFP